MLFVQVTPEEFSLPTLGPKLVELAAEVTHGRGFQIFRCDDETSQLWHSF